MKILHCDCFAGISGDMFLAALIDLGADAENLRQKLGTLGVGGWQIKLSKDSRGGVWGTRADVLCQKCAENQDSHLRGVKSAQMPLSIEKNLNQHQSEAAPSGGHEYPHAHAHEHSHEHPHAHRCGESGNAPAPRANAADDSAHQHRECHGHHEHRSFSDIKKLIENSSIPQGAKETSLKIFSILAEAEAKVHNKEVSEVAFHEVGAVDSIIDIVGAAICLDELGIEKITHTPVELGSGTVACAHGIMPVPAPATALLSQKFPFKLGGVHHECTTPTGAAIIAALAKPQEASEVLKNLGVGIGIGHRDGHRLPNFLRVCLFEAPAEGPSPACAPTEMLVELAANIDDMPAEKISYLCEKLFEAGALDVWQESIAMKKGRLGCKVCALAGENLRNALLSVFFTHSTTLGVRSFAAERSSIRRVQKCVETPYGEIRVKTASRGGFETSKADFDDLRAAAQKSGKSLSEIEREIFGG